jgi:cytidine deaminase
MELRDLTDSDVLLIEAAISAIDAAMDDALHTVGAAVLDASGNVHVGINHYHFTGGPCAELVALSNARAAGAGELVTIVAVRGEESREVMSPCGRDRQVFIDYYPNIRVLLTTPNGVKSVSCQDLLPFSYRNSEV